MIEFLGFDADDTLWHTERLYAEVQSKFDGLLAHYHDREWIQERLLQTENRNIHHFGYGIKAFTLSLIETAIELTEGRITSSEIGEIVGWGRGMIQADVELLPDVARVVAQLAAEHSLILITKGDLLDQETKIRKSGLEKHFEHIEIVSQKTAETYEGILRKHGIPKDRFMMVGNSLASDIWPVLKLGGSAVHIPYEITWLHENAETPSADQAGFYELKGIGDLPGLMKVIRQDNG
jgi:putative hydrolase of the HAD superfamily